jgi:hypothetical protein
MTCESHYDTLVVGATCAGLGYALNHPEHLLVVDSGSLAGREFVETMDPGQGWETEPSLDDNTEDLRRELERRNIAADGCVHLPALGPVLFERLRLSGIDYLFLTNILGLTRGPTDYVADLFNVEGHHTVRANRILDTTVRRESLPGHVVAMETQSICATLSNPDGTPCPQQQLTADCAMRPGRFRGEAFLCLTVPVTCDWVTARDRLHQFWMDRPEPLRSWDLVSVATRLRQRSTEVPAPGKGHVLLQSARYENPLAAYAAGATHELTGPAKRHEQPAERLPATARA